MKVKQTIPVLAAFFFLFSFSLSMLVPVNSVYAADPADPADSDTTTAPSGCGDIKTAIIKCDDSKGGNAIWGILLLVLRILTAGVGIVAVGGIVFAALLYASAGDNAGQVTKAKELIFNVVLGLVAYAAMFAFLQWIIPGGVFS
ncbi:MAG: hypothetical protein ACSLEY_02805 [Candidatus Saccharimonadales bacterium]